MRIAIYSGSFNPFHNGHFNLAMYLVDNDIVDEVWLVVSPQNPLKNNAPQISKEDRFKMVEQCFSGKTKIKPSDVEFNLPVPSYSIDTLNHLSETFPLHEFFLIIGSDNAAVFDQWKNHQEILNKYQVLVYPRRNYSIDDAILKYPAMKVLNTPYYDISSTEVRDLLRQGKDVSGFVPPQVLEFIQAKGLYQ